MKQKRLNRAACLLLLVLLCTTGCAGRGATASEVLGGMCRAEKPLPAGKLYVLSAPEDSEEQLCPDLFAVIFGNGNPTPELDLLEDAAIYLCYTEPIELAVFLCKSTDGTDAVAKMCLRRLEILKNYRNTGDMTEQEHPDPTEHASVSIHGRWVVLCVSTNPDAVLRAFRKSL